LKDHFVAWIREREECRRTGRVFDRHKVFTLCSYPWILDAANKSEFLKIQNSIEMDNQIRLNPMNLLMGMGGLYLIMEISRESMLEDTLRQIQVLKADDFKKKLRVMFKNEPGIDEGGVKKEFFQILIRQLFDPNFGMFNYNDKERLYWFNGLSHEPNINFELIGILMGLAIFNNIIIDVPLPRVCYK
jgi:ubiquitin-protein ligase E3 A